MSGDLVRKAERRKTRLTLGMARTGDLLELAAALGDGIHTCTVTAQTQGVVMLLPLKNLQDAFLIYPPLRMRLLEELAREVSRSYVACFAVHFGRMRLLGHPPARTARAG